MSGYYVGPFGRMLPSRDGQLSEQSSERPANRSETGDNPYQLPPPRTPANLQFGSDPFLRHRQSDNSESGRGPTSAESVSQRQQTEQLPSVRQLLTPSNDPSSSPSYPRTFAALGPHIDHREHSYPYRHHEPSLPSQITPVGVQDSTKSRSESLPRPQNGLPPLSQVTMHSPRDIKHHTATRSDPMATSIPHSQIPVHGTSYQEKALSSGLSSPESGSRTKGSTTLPHVVDERYIDGEGICYIYADGSHCPKAIEGIPVNANWGVTKAGKPRKRLAQACLTCREKKIKCQPNLPKCDQCQKSGRECRFESAPRGNRSSMRGPHSAGPSSKYDGKEGFSPSLANSDVSSLYNMPRASNSATSLPGTSGHSPISEGTRLTPSGTEGTYETMAEADRAYRSRMYRIPQPFAGDDSIARAPEHIEASRLPEYTEILGELRDINPDDPLAGSWNIDPYESDPDVTMHYIESYFSNVNDGLYHIFPHARFILWLKSSQMKSAEDKMLLYSMMALGSIFSDRPGKVVALRRYSRIARFAVQKSQHTLSLQLAQSHLILSLWYYATGSLVGCWDSIGAAGRAVSGLRYNMESGGVVVDHSQVCDYGLHPQALIECRRRTFWVAFILDRVSNFFSAPSSFISSESALIRLPCREEIYEAQQYTTAPYFQSVLNQHSAPEDDRSALSPMAFLIQILSIWGDVSLHILRLSHIPPEGYVRLAEEFHINIVRRTEDWLRQIPEHLAFSAINMERASQAKKADTFISIHMFYHATLMKLYRHARYQGLRSELLTQYIHRARYHAVETLRIALAVTQYANEMHSAQSPPETPSPKVTLLSPFLGYAVLSAVDVLSAAGLVAELPDCISFIRGALGMIQLLGRHWDSSLEVTNIIQKRLDSMIDCLHDRIRSQDKMGFAVDGPSLETKIHAYTSPSHLPGALEEDLFYGSLPREVLLHSMRTDGTAFSEPSIVWLRDH
ncbi:hypothetical protein N7448_000449 [Penicillium atrosanguineum]|nr:hypothetical protein N7448_000449 [Penicillium atrosanguineum]